MAWREVTKESLKYFTELEILAHCLYEMNFGGLEEEEIQEQLDSINKTAEQYDTISEEEKCQNTAYLEELLDEFEEDNQENDQFQ